VESHCFSTETILVDTVTISYFPILEVSSIFIGLMSEELQSEALQFMALSGLTLASHPQSDSHGGRRATTPLRQLQVIAQYRGFRYDAGAPYRNAAGAMFFPIGTLTC